jgi:hypothetical protein
MAMARVTIVRAEKVVRTLDRSGAVIVLLVGLCHHPGACEEHDE